MDKSEMHDVPRSLSTTSAKIRALAEAGFDRVEISQILEIRYQRVRKVLLETGSVSGLRRSVEAQRESIIVDAPSSARTSDVARCAAEIRLCLDWEVGPNI